MRGSLLQRVGLVELISDAVSHWDRLRPQQAGLYERVEDTFHPMTRTVYLTTRGRLHTAISGCRGSRNKSHINI